MARTSITVGNLTRNAGTDVTAAVSAGATGTNGYNIASFDRDEIVILARETANGATGSMIIKAPTADGLYGTGRGVGDLTVTVGGSAEVAVIVDGSRFKKTDGSIDIDMVAAGGTAFTGAVMAIDPTGM